MTKQPFNWDDAFEEVARENRRQSIASEPGARAKAEAERRRYIKLGWMTEDGEPGPNADQASDETDDETNEDEE